jgi:hypothetical protein
MVTRKGSSSSGESLRGAAHAEEFRWPRLAQRFPFVPPMPTSVRVARLPPPPLLDPKKTGAEHALELAIAYREVVARYYPYAKLFKGVTAKTLVGMPQFPELLSAAEKLLRFKIAPIAWCAFRLETWLEYRIGGKASAAWDAVPSEARKQKNIPPPVRWMYGAIEDRNAWFAYSESKWSGGRMFTSSAYSELNRLWWEMRTELVRSDVTEEQARAIVRRHFPGARYKTLVKDSETDADFKQAELDEAVRRRRFVW